MDCKSAVTSKRKGTCRGISRHNERRRSQHAWTYAHMNASGTCKSKRTCRGDGRYRVDSGMQLEQTVPVHFNPMLSPILVPSSANVLFSRQQQHKFHTQQGTMVVQRSTCCWYKSCSGSTSQCEHNLTTVFIHTVSFHESY